MKDNPSIVTQPHLGRVKDNYKPHTNMGGYLALAKVIKVHHKHRTADVSIINSRDILTSGSDNEGRFGVKIGTSHASFDDTLLSSSGVIEPLQKGDLVLLAFLDGNKSKPVILSCFHNIDSSNNNVLPLTYPINPEDSVEERKEALKYLKVYPSQLYQKVDGEGGVEVSLPSKSFLKVDSDRDNLVSDSHNGFDHDDLSEKDPRTSMTRSGPTEDSLLPVNMLLVHRTDFQDKDTTWTKFFLDRSGMFRTTRDTNNGRLTYQEIGKDGKYTLRRQLDSAVHGQGSNYSEVSMGEDGDILVVKSSGSSKTQIIIGADGKLSISSDKKIFINGDLQVEGSVDANSLTRNGVQVATVDQIHN